MKPKHPTKREEKRLMSFTDQMEFLFAVNNYDRSFTYKQKDDKEWVAVEIEINVPYQRINTAIYPIFWTYSLKEQRKILLHEFCHIIIQPVQAVAADLFEGKFRTEEERKNAIEQSTSRVTQLLDSLLQGKNKYAAKAYEKYLKK